MEFLSEYSQYLSENVVFNIYGFYGFITVLIMVFSFIFAYVLGGKLGKIICKLFQKFRKGEIKNSEI